MAMPNRLTQVKEIVKKYPQAFGGDDATIDARRRLLIPIIARELNKLDGGNWFVLNRLDRQDEDPKPGRLTSDVIVWGPTKEHVDVLSASGAMWQNHGPVTDSDWKIEPWSNWPTWDGQAPEPDEPDEPTDPSPDVEAILARLTALETRVNKHLKD